MIHSGFEDEILDDEAPNIDDDIDIVGEEMKAQEKVEKNLKSSAKFGIYGPNQFTEEDVLAVAEQVENEEHNHVVKDEEDDNNNGDENISVDETCQKKWCSQCQVPKGKLNLFIKVE